MQPLQLASSASEDAYSKLIDTLPYSDDPITDAERRMVQEMIRQEMETMEERQEDASVDDPALVPPKTSVASDSGGIDTEKYTNPVDVRTARIALEYGTRRRVEAQMQVRYGAMQYRAGNEVYGSVLGRGAEVLRGLKGDIGMVNRERKGDGGGEVGGELGRVGRAWEAGVRKNLVLEGLLRAEEEGA